MSFRVGSVAHPQHRGDHRELAPHAIGNASEQPAPDRAQWKTHGKDRGGVETLHRRIAGRKKRMREIEGRERVFVEVLPLDRIARRRAHDCHEPLAVFVPAAFDDAAVVHVRLVFRHRRRGLRSTTIR